MELLTTKEAAKYLGVHYVTLLNYMKAGFIKPDYKRKNKNAWSKELLDKFKNLQLLDTTAAAAYLGIHRVTLSNYKKAGIIKPAFQKRNKDWWSKELLDKFKNGYSVHEKLINDQKTITETKE